MDPIHRKFLRLIREIEAPGGLRWKRIEMDRGGWSGAKAVIPEPVRRGVSGSDACGELFTGDTEAVLALESRNVNSPLPIMAFGIPFGGLVAGSVLNTPQSTGLPPSRAKRPRAVLKFPYSREVPPSSYSRVSAQTVLPSQARASLCP